MMQGTIHKGSFEREGLGMAAFVSQAGSVLSHNVFFGQSTIIQVMAGEKTLLLGNKNIIVPSGSGIVVAGDQTMDMFNHLPENGDFRGRWLIIDSEIISAQTHESGAKPILDHLSFSIEPEFGRLLDTIFSSFEDHSFLPEVIVRARIQESLKWIEFHGGYLVAAAEPAIETRLRKIIQKEPNRSWKVKDVCNQLAMSESTLRRHLSQRGYTFTGIIQEVRMNMAYNLIITTETSIGLIGESVGYQNSSRFAARFYHHFGHAPSILRGHRRQNERIGT